jgi:hypothetical protein
VADIRESIENAVRYLTEHPDEARYTDSFARATLGEALRVEVEGPDRARIVTDMPEGVGGRAEKPSPGWLYRAAIASCVASTIGMEAAREGVTLGSLQVEVDSESDDRGSWAWTRQCRQGRSQRGSASGSAATGSRRGGCADSSSAGRGGAPPTTRRSGPSRCPWRSSRPDAAKGRRYLDRFLMRCSASTSTSDGVSIEAPRAPASAPRTGLMTPRSFSHACNRAG